MSAAAEGDAPASEAGAPQPAPAPSARDAALLAWLGERDAALLGFACELIATPSVNPPGDERAVAALVADRLRELDVVDVATVGGSPERPNVIAHVGDGSPTLVLSGHLDTKPAGELEAWATGPWDPVVRDGQLYGLGSGDMKCAVAAMVYAAGALRALPAPPAGRLSLVLTADEEAGSVHGSKWLAEEGLLHADAAVIGEPCGVAREWEEIDLISRGAALFRVRVRGTQMHSSISDRLPGVNATVAMARLIERMDRELLDALTFAPHPLVARPTLNVGVMAQAGVYYGVYPGAAEFACDLRTLPGMTRDQVEADLRAFLARAAAADPELDAELVVDAWVPATEISPAEPIVGDLQAACALVLDEQPRLGAFPGATDAPHFQLTAGIPTVAAFGPGLLPRAHSPNEHLAAASVGQAARIYALAAARYLAR